VIEPLDGLVIENGRPCNRAIWDCKPETNEKEKKMRKFGVLLVALSISTSALAFHCPADMKKIDDALAMNPKLPAEQISDVKKLRADGETLHKAGKHQESVDALGKAMKILGV
jgi:hypothetical protein